MEHKRSSKNTWMPFLVLAVFLLGHLILFYFARRIPSRAEISGAILGAVVLLALAKHLGFFAALYAHFKRRYRA